jgi:hypothetical protein
MLKYRKNLKIISGKRNKEFNKTNEKVQKAVPLHAMEVLRGRGSIAPTHSRNLATSRPK